MSKIIGAVEIGTSKAKALVGEVTENGKLSIVGMASRPNEGMRQRRDRGLSQSRRCRACLLGGSGENVRHHGRFRIPGSNRYPSAWPDAVWLGLGQFFGKPGFRLRLGTARPRRRNSVNPKKVVLTSITYARPCCSTASPLRIRSG